MGGLFEKTDTRTLNGWPGLAEMPFLHYLFSEDKIEHQENESFDYFDAHASCGFRNGRRGICGRCIRDRKRRCRCSVKAKCGRHDDAHAGRDAGGTPAHGSEPGARLRRRMPARPERRSR